MDWKEELTKLVDEAVGDKTGEEKDAAVFAALKSHLPSDYVQIAVDKGHSMATGELKSKVEKLTDEKKALEGKLETAQSKVSELEGRTLPEDASEREAELSKRIDELQADLDKAEEERKAEREKYEADRKAAKIESFKSRSRIAAREREGGAIDSAHFELQLIEAEREGRLDVDGDKVILRQRGRTSPVQADSLDELAKHFADEVGANAPDKYIESRVDAGGGSSGGSGGSGKWGKYREAAKGTQEANGISDESKSKRMQGMT